MSDTLKACKQFLEDMHSMPIDWTITNSQELHKQVADALAAIEAAPQEIKVKSLKRYDFATNDFDKPIAREDFDGEYVLHDEAQEQINAAWWDGLKAASVGEQPQPSPVDPMGAGRAIQDHLDSLTVYGVNSALPVAPDLRKEWTITAPDGRTWTGDTVFKAASAAQRDTIDPVLAMERINAALAEVEPIAKRCYTMTEPHLSGYRVIMGFENMEDAQAAHQYIADIESVKGK